jgi:hypothetical protein
VRNRQEEYMRTAHCEENARQGKRAHLLGKPNATSGHRDILAHDLHIANVSTRHDCAVLVVKAHAGPDARSDPIDHHVGQQFVLYGGAAMAVQYGGGADMVMKYGGGADMVRYGGGADMALKYDGSAGSEGSRTS